MRLCFALTFVFKEAVEAKVFVQFFPMKAEGADFKFHALCLRSIL